MSSIFGRRRAKTKCQFWFNLASINVSFECALNPKSHLYAEMVVFVERYRPPPNLETIVSCTNTHSSASAYTLVNREQFTSVILIVLIYRCNLQLQFISFAQPQSKCLLLLLLWFYSNTNICNVNQVLNSTFAMYVLICYTPRTRTIRYYIQGCQIFLGTTYLNGSKYTKWPQNIPNCHKMDQMAVTYAEYQ
jgi:hypothetical protein